MVAVSTQQHICGMFVAMLSAPVVLWVVMAFPAGACELKQTTAAAPDGSRSVA
jgi:hypothetical protein